MLATITTKTIVDRWKPIAIAAVTIALFLLGGMAAYQTIDISLYTNMPEAFRSLINIGDNATASGLAYNAIYGFYGALILAGLAISMGSASIAGEEKNGTIGVLLGNPRSRNDMLASKAASTFVLLLFATLVLWAGGVLAPIVLSVDVTGFLVGAQIIHLFAVALFFGYLAMAIGAWTGKPAFASGASTGVLVVSFFAVGILPLFDSVADLAKVFPWYYLTGGDPLTNGVQWDGITILSSASIVLTIVAFVGVNRRDLRTRSMGRSLLDRLRDDPRIGGVVDRLSGSGGVSSIWRKAVTDHQVLTGIAAVTMFSMMGLLMGPMYAALDDTLAAFTADLPEAFGAIIGTSDLSTPAGWFQAETFSLMAPALIMAVSITVGAKALAGEEAQRTMGLLLASPVRRSRVVLQKATAMVILASVVALATFLGVSGGVLIASLDLSFGNVAATSLLALLLGLVFGSLALMLSAATGRVNLAVIGSIGTAFLAYLINSFLPLSEGLAAVAAWSPFDWYLGSDPLVNGMAWADAGLLATIVIVLIAASVFFFERRDLRSGS